MVSFILYCFIFRELIARSFLSMPQEPGLMEQMSKNITRSGLTHNTLNFLRLCVILEPMQELMSRQKAFNLGPRECLKTTLFQKWQRMVAPPGQPGKTGVVHALNPFPLSLLVVGWPLIVHVAVSFVAFHSVINKGELPCWWWERNYRRKARQRQW